jgi:phage FluMu protein Com
MAEATGETTFELSCPHCSKVFSARLLQGRAERYRGFKCPHCKLFVPYERANEAGLLSKRT